MALTISRHCVSLDDFAQHLAVADELGEIEFGHDR
jgi:hypothetical protein